MNATRRSRAWLLVMLALFAVALAMLGCGERESSDPEVFTRDSTPLSVEGDSTTRAVNAAFGARVAEMMRTAPPGLDPCSVAKHVTSALDTIERWPRPLFAGNDNCVLAMLDSLAEGFISTGSGRYLELLDTCQAYGDGYVAEYIEELAGRIFELRSSGLVRYLHTHRDPGAPLEQPLIAAWRRRFDERPDSLAQKQSLLATVRARTAGDSLSVDEQAYVDMLLRQARVIR